MLTRNKVYEVGIYFVEEVINAEYPDYVVYWVKTKKLDFLGNALPVYLRYFVGTMKNRRFYKFVTYYPTSSDHRGFYKWRTIAEAARMAVSYAERLAGISAEVSEQISEITAELRLRKQVQKEISELSEQLPAST